MYVDICLQTGYSASVQLSTYAQELFMKLTESEWKIANCLWENKSMTIAEITDELNESTGWTRFTVITLLKRMLEKGAVSFVQEGRTKIFSPAIEKSEAENEEVESLLDKVYNGNAGLLISNLIGSEKLTPEQLEELRKIIEG